MNARAHFDSIEYGFLKVLGIDKKILINGEQIKSRLGSVITVTPAEIGILAILIHDANNRHEGLSRRTIAKVLGFASEKSVKVHMTRLKKALSYVEIAPDVISGITADSLILTNTIPGPLASGMEVRSFRLNKALIDHIQTKSPITYLIRTQPNLNLGTNKDARRVAAFIGPEKTSRQLRRISL